MYIYFKMLQNIGKADIYKTIALIHKITTSICGFNIYILLLSIMFVCTFNSGAHYVCMFRYADVVVVVLCLFNIDYQYINIKIQI